MNKVNQKIAIAALSALIGGGALLPYQIQASSLAPVAKVQQAAVTNFKAQYGEAIKHLIDKGVLQGYSNGDMRSERPVSNAELLKMVLLTLELDVDTSDANTAQGAKWYDAYVDAAMTGGLIASADAIKPNSPAEQADIAAIIAKALQRDVKSVQIGSK